MALWDVGWADWDPWAEFDRMRRRMWRLMRGLGVPVEGPAFPPVNVWTDDEKAVVTAEVPGLRPEQVELTVTRDVLTLKGERKEEGLAEGERYVRRERPSGAFARTVRLPFEVDASKVEATCKDGILRVVLPRAEEQKPRKIEIAGQ